jgi:threonyl-tRNA synthetase
LTLNAQLTVANARYLTENINISLGDGKIIEGQSWVTSPADIARGISKSLFERTVIARLDKGTPEETLWDLERPLEKSCKLELLPFDDPEGKKVFWHSSAHILGEASERRFGCDLCIGPPIEDGFYYEVGSPSRSYTSTLTTSDGATREGCG